MRFLDRELAALFGKPDPAAGEMASAALGELLGERVERAEGRVDLRRQLACRARRVGGKRLPVKAVVPALRSVVEQFLVPGPGLGDDRLEALAGQLGASIAALVLSM